MKAIPNPDQDLCYVTIITNPEVTFFGVKGQPDFAQVTIEYIARDTVIELKALKEYFVAFREKILSYERFISVVYRDLIQKYQPRWLKLTAEFNPRGGIRSQLVMDSDKPTHEVAESETVG